MQPWLAESHTVSPNGLIWDFKLRAGVKFHDGSELTADDVVYSFRRILAVGKAPSAPFLPILKPDSVTTPDRYSVRFQLDRTHGPFFATIPMVFINPRAVKQHEKDGDWERAGSLNEAGSGAYRHPRPMCRSIMSIWKSTTIIFGLERQPRPIKKIEWRLTQVTRRGVGASNACLT
jgi:peptide/nickel transport system substrate-binding protein